MKLTLGQVRGTLKLSPDAYRHWKTVLPPLATRQGRGASFSHGDLLALAIVKSLTDRIGVPVGNLDIVARKLFEQCGKQPWAKFERLSAFISTENWSLSFISDGRYPQTGTPSVFIPCGPIIASLRSALMIEHAEDTQANLRFPLSAVANRRRIGGGKS
jgi:hypothetical protein